MANGERQYDSGPSGVSTVRHNEKPYIESQTREVVRIQMGKFMLDKPRPAEPHPEVKRQR